MTRDLRTRGSHTRGMPRKSWAGKGWEEQEVEDGQRDVSERRVPGVKYSIEKLFDIIERGIFRAAAGYEL